MKPLAERVWSEPAVFIGLLTSIILAAGAILTGSDWTWETIVAVFAPLASALGIRGLVVPTVNTDPPVPKVPA